MDEHMVLTCNRRMVARESENERRAEWLDSRSNKAEWIKETEGSVVQVAVATNE